MMYKLRSGIICSYDTDSVLFIDIYQGRRMRIKCSVKEGFFDGEINKKSLSYEHSFWVNVLVNKQYLVCCITDDQNKRIAQEIVNGVSL